MSAKIFGITKPSHQETKEEPILETSCRSVQVTSKDNGRCSIYYHYIE